MTKTLLRAGALSCALLASSALTMPAMAQGGALPRFNQVDANGVDLYTGDFFFSLVEGTIGSGEGALSLVRNWAGAAGWTDNWSGRLYPGGPGIIVEFGTYSDSFTVSGGAYISTKADGATLTNMGGGLFRYVARDGTRIDYLLQSPQGFPLAGDNCQGCGVPVEIRRPNGMTYALNWDFAETCMVQDEGNCVSSAGFVRFRGVANSANYAFTVDYASDSPVQYQQPQDDWYRRTQVEFTNLDGAPSSLPTVTYSQVSSTVLDVTDTGGQTWRLTNGYAGRLTAVRRPGASTDTVNIGYGATMDVTRDGVTTNYARYVSGSGGSMTVTDANGGETFYVLSLTKERVTSVFDAAGQTTSYGYDGNGRIADVSSPEGNTTHYSYDARGNVIEVRLGPKSGAAPDLVTSASYSSTCANPVVCNLPDSTTDARGNVTDYTYDGTHGGLLTVTAPAPGTGAARPQTRYSYSAVTAVSGQPVTLPTEVSACASGTAAGSPSCLGTAAESRTVIAYDSDNLRTTSVTARNGDNSLSATTAFTYDAIGNTLTADGPLAGSADTVRFRYDAGRRATGAVGPDPDGAGSLKHRAVRTTYTNGLPTKVERGTVDSQSDGDWAAFSPLERAEQDYDAYARPTVQRLVSGSTTYALTQTSYDNLGRVRCTAQRMNPAEFASLPADACTLDTQGSFGPDRISRTSYDALGRVTLVETGVGTAAEADEAATTYTANGQVHTVTDAEGNATYYHYNTHDRRDYQVMPSPTTAGTWNWSDYEYYAYDENGNLTYRILRDGQTVGFSYDALNRLAVMDRPGTDPDVTYVYDNLSRLLSATDANGHYAQYGHDALGRVLTEANPYTGTVAHRYDLAGRHKRLTWSDGNYIAYDYDAAGGMTHVRENGAASGAGLLAVYAYDDLGRRISLTRGNGTMTSYGYDNVSRLSELTQNLNGSASDVTFGYSHNPAGEIVSNTRSNDAYSFTLANANAVGTPNGLNQLTTLGGTSIGHDARGNVSAIGGSSYSYDSANRMTGAAGASGYIYYEPLGRLSFIYDPAGTRARQYAGAQLVGEYISGVAQRRFVPGPGLDEPLVWYEGSGLSDRRWLHADERGSVIAVSDGSGNLVGSINRYDDYGAPQGGAITGRFGYTGQVWMPGLNLYDYRARVYNPALGGRFMQTDPIGYEGGMNLYAYVGNNPVNLTDPAGTNPPIATGTRIPNKQDWGPFCGGCSGFSYLGGGAEMRKQTDYMQDGRVIKTTYGPWHPISGFASAAAYSSAMCETAMICAMERDAQEVFSRQISEEEFWARARARAGGSALGVGILASIATGYGAIATASALYRLFVIFRMVGPSGALNMSRTVMQQMTSRSYISRQSILDAVRYGSRSPDAQGAAGFFMYRIAGSHHGNSGTLEVLVNEGTGLIVHVLFRR